MGNNEFWGAGLFEGTRGLTLLFWGVTCVFLTDEALAAIHFVWARAAGAQFDLLQWIPILVLTVVPWAGALRIWRQARKLGQGTKEAHFAMTMIGASYGLVTLLLEALLMSRPMR